MTDGKPTSLPDEVPRSLNLTLTPLSASSAQSTQLLHAGDLCPKCKVERLDYDGLLNLACPKCGLVQTGGCFS
jgi:hypothetical protein